MDAGTKNLLTKIAIYAGIGFALYYFLPKLIAQGAQQGLKALNSVGSALGTGLYDLIHPNELGETTFYMVNFPNGSRHSIPSSQVNAKGQFRYALVPEVEKTWQLMKDVKTGMRVAARV